jgi:hypothetical protein
MKRLMSSKRTRLLVIFLTLFLFGVSRGEDGHQGTESEAPRISDVRWVVPSKGLPPEAAPLPANNNVAIERFDGKLYMAWRSAPTHFASDRAALVVTSSSDEGRTWRLERRIERHTDVREPHFVVMKGSLILYFMELGSTAVSFEPKQALRVVRRPDGSWTDVEKAPLPPRMMIWEIKTHDDVAYMTTYVGNHYSSDNDAAIDIHFKKSTDGLTWEDVNPARPVIYHGGVSEVAFEFDGEGNLWAVTRNEDGDQSGFGSHVAFAPHNALGEWQFPDKSSPFRYDSPRMFRQGDDIYLVARRNIVFTGDGDRDFVDAPFDVWGDGDDFLPLSLRRASRLLAYSARPKKTSVYKIDRRAHAVVWLKDLPSAGDTAFASVAQLDAQRFVIANYSNPVRGGGFAWAPDSQEAPADCDGAARWSWIRGQTSRACGTRIYLATLTFP